MLGRDSFGSQAFGRFVEGAQGVTQTVIVSIAAGTVTTTENIPGRLISVTATITPGFASGNLIFVNRAGGPLGSAAFGQEPFGRSMVIDGTASGAVISAVATLEPGFATAPGPFVSLVGFGGPFGGGAFGQDAFGRETGNRSGAQAYGQVIVVTASSSMGIAVGQGAVSPTGASGGPYGSFPFGSGAFGRNLFDAGGGSSISGAILDVDADLIDGIGTGTANVFGHLVQVTVTLSGGTPRGSGFTNGTSYEVDIFIQGAQAQGSANAAGSLLDVDVSFIPGAAVGTHLSGDVIEVVASIASGIAAGNVSIVGQILEVAVSLNRSASGATLNIGCFLDAGIATGTGVSPSPSPPLANQGAGFASYRAPRYAAPNSALVDGSRLWAAAEILPCHAVGGAKIGSFTVSCQAILLTGKARASANTRGVDLVALRQIVEGKAVGHDMIAHDNDFLIMA